MVDEELKEEVSKEIEQLKECEGSGYGVLQHYSQDTFDIMSEADDLIYSPIFGRRLEEKQGAEVPDRDLTCLTKALDSLGYVREYDLIEPVDEKKAEAYKQELDIPDQQAYRELSHHEMVERAQEQIMPSQEEDMVDEEYVGMLGGSAYGSSDVNYRFSR